MRRTFLLQHGIPTRNFSFMIQVLAALLLWLPCLSSLGHAQVPPITPSGLSTQVNLSSTPPLGVVQYDITGGTRPGGGANLFHSFGEFGVPANNIANFLNGVSFDLNGTPLATGLPTSNILGRVTGENPSNILGTIQTTGFGNANLFLMNPNGFLFGPNATVNVGGMVAFTSADYLRMTDGALFNKTPNVAQDALLSASPLAAFGFLGSNPGAITVQGSQLTVTEGSGISLVGGNITIESGTLDSGVVQPAVLSAPAGRINFASAASPGEFLAGTLDQAPNINRQSFAALGEIQISQKSLLDVSGNGSGSVIIRGGRFLMDESMIFANVTGPGIVTDGLESIGRGIDIEVSQDAVIQNGAILETTVSGNASSIVKYSGVSVKADRIEILGSQDFENFPVTGIFSSVVQGSTGGNSGDIKLESNSILAREFGTFTTFLETATDGAGNSGNILVKASGNLEMDGVVFVNTFSGNSASGNAGNIEFTSTGGNILLTNSPFVDSQSAASSSGSVGSIAVNAPNGDILLAGNPNNGPAVVFTHIDGTGPNAGKGGIQLSAKNLTIENSGIQIDNFTPFQPGDLTVNLTDTLSLSGTDIPSTLLTTTRRSAQSADLNITAPVILLADGSRVSAETYRSGDGGTLNIFTQHLELRSGAQITSGSIFNPNLFPGDPPETPSGAGGTITIQGLQSPAESVLIDGARSGIFTDTEGTGAGGKIFIESNQVQLTDQATISANTTGTGRAGDVTLVAEDIALAGFSAIATNTSGAGDAGNIRLTAPSVEIVNSAISALTLARGNAGNILLEVSSLTLTDEGNILASTQGTGRGGDITIRGLSGLGSHAEDVTLTGLSTLDTTTLIESGPAGNVSIDTARLTVADESQITSSSQEGSGRAGNLLLNATNSITVSGGFIFSASLFGSTGNGGQVWLTTPALTVQAGPSGFGGVISTSTSGAGQAGNVTINANTVSLSNGGQVASNSSLLGVEPSTGSGGTVTVQGLQGPGSRVNSVTINGGDSFGNQSGIFTDTEGTGAGGNVSVSANSVTLQNGGTISAATSGTTPTATGGSIVINATEHVTLTNSSSVTASSTGPGNTGNIQIDAGNQFAMANSTVTTQANQASGGTIKITTIPSGTVQLTNSTISASVLDGAGGGGSVDIDPQYVILQSSQILAQAVQGPGGNITITITNGGLFLPDANSVVSASSQFGVNGTVTIQSPNAPASGQIQPLGKSPLLATSLLNQHCAALAGGEFSSFTVAGRDSLPTEPGSWLASPLAFATLSGGSGLGTKAEGGKAEGERLETPLLSLRQIAPAGFLTQAFAVEGSSSCQS